MAITWTDFNNGDNLGAIRTSINTFNNSVVTDVNLNTSKTDQNTVDVATNTSDIASIRAGEPKDTIEFTPQVTAPTHLEGRMYYSADKAEVRIQGPYPGVEVAVGHGMHTHVINNTGATIEKGSACRQVGVDLQGRVQVAKAIADNFVNARVFGVASTDILDGVEGAITTFGEVDAFDTSLLPSGVPLYLSDTVAGTYTATAPDIVSRVGGVTIQDAATGVLFVSIINNYNIPTVFGGMVGQNTPSYDLTTTAQDIVDYTTDTSIVLPVNLTTGEITLSNDGEYRVNVTATLSYVSSTSTRSVIYEVYDVTNTEIHYDYESNIPKDSTRHSISFSYPLAELANNVHKLRIKASTAMTVSIDNISFDMQSVSIR